MHIWKLSYLLYLNIYPWHNFLIARKTSWYKSILFYIILFFVHFSDSPEESKKTENDEGDDNEENKDDNENVDDFEDFIDADEIYNDDDVVHEQNKNKDKKNENNFAHYQGSVAEYKIVKNTLLHLSEYSVKELKEKIIFYLDENASNKTNNFLEKIEIRNYLKKILLFKLKIEDLRLLLEEEMKIQNISDNKSSSSFSVSFSEVIKDYDKKSIVFLLLKSNN